MLSFASSEPECGVVAEDVMVNVVIGRRAPYINCGTDMP